MACVRTVLVTTCAVAHRHAHGTGLGGSAIDKVRRALPQCMHKHGGLHTHTHHTHTHTPTLSPHQPSTGTACPAGCCCGCCCCSHTIATTTCARTRTRARARAHTINNIGARSCTAPLPALTAACGATPAQLQCTNGCGGGVHQGFCQSQRVGRVCDGGFWRGVRQAAVDARLQNLKARRHPRATCERHKNATPRANTRTKSAAPRVPPSHPHAVAIQPCKSQRQSEPRRQQAPPHPHPHTSRRMRATGSVSNSSSSRSTTTTT